MVSFSLSSTASLGPVAGHKIMSRRLEIGQDAVDDHPCSVCLTLRFVIVHGRWYICVSHGFSGMVQA